MKALALPQMRTSLFPTLPIPVNLEYLLRQANHLFHLLSRFLPHQLHLPLFLRPLRLSLLRQNSPLLQKRLPTVFILMSGLKTKVSNLYLKAWTRSAYLPYSVATPTPKVLVPNMSSPVAQDNAMDISPPLNPTTIPDDISDFSDSGSSNHIPIPEVADLGSSFKPSSISTSSSHSKNSSVASKVKSAFSKSVKTVQERGIELYERCKPSRPQPIRVTFADLLRQISKGKSPPVIPPPLNPTVSSVPIIPPPPKTPVRRPSISLSDSTHSNSNSSDSGDDTPPSPVGLSRGPVGPIFPTPLDHPLPPSATALDDATQAEIQLMVDDLFQDRLQDPTAPMGGALSNLFARSSLLTFLLLADSRAKLAPLFSKYLEPLNLRYFFVYGMMVCTPCQSALEPSQLVTHLNSVHHFNQPYISFLFAQLIAKGLIIRPVEADLPTGGAAPFVGLKIITKGGLQCTKCNYACTVPKSMSNHWSGAKDDRHDMTISKHLRSYNSAVQRWTPNKGSYWSVSPSLAELNVTDPYSVFRRNLASLPPIPPAPIASPHSVPPLLRLTQWHERLSTYAEDATLRNHLRNLIYLPRSKQKADYPRLRELIDRFLRQARMDGHRLGYMGRLYVQDFNQKCVFCFDFQVFTQLNFTLDRLITTFGLPLQTTPACATMGGMLNSCSRP